MASKSIDDFRTRAGVPVFNRPTVNPFSRNAVPNPMAAGSPKRPDEASYSPMKILPSMKVPVVSTTTRQDI